MTLTTIEVINLWCKEANHDKVYRIEVVQNEDNGHCDVFATYGRRGGTQVMTVKMENENLNTALNFANQLAANKIRKGYRSVTEDVARSTKLTVKL